jgi:hypothetical protein
VTVNGSRFARHVLLGEIGSHGQETLSAARYRIPFEADARVASVTRIYLDRAGLVEARAGREVPDLGTTVAKTAGGPHLEHAAAFLLGALAAVEHVKSEIGLGRPMKTLPPLLP